MPALVEDTSAIAAVRGLATAKQIRKQTADTAEGGAPGSRRVPGNTPQCLIWTPPTSRMFTNPPTPIRQGAAPIWISSHSP